MLFLLSEAAFGQRSCVFVDREIKAEGRAHRPPPRTRLLDLPKRPPQQPQTAGTANWDFPNINISQWFARDQNETAIAINPTDEKNLIVGANDYRTLNTLWYFTSTDGGFTWQSGELPADQALYAATDPSVGIGPDGVAYYGNGRVDISGFPYPVNDVVAYKSTTKGASWNAPVRVFYDPVATKLADKYYLAVAPTSFGPLAPRVYMAWAEYIDGKSRIVVSASGDGGASWAEPAQLTALGKFQAPVPVVGTGGEVYVTFIDLDTMKKEILFSKSTDGGLNFTSPKKIANYENLGPLYPPDDAYPHPVIKGHLRVNSFPSIAVDHSFKHFNRLYTTWAGKGTDGRHHIYLSKSDDQGETWSEALPIENDKSAINTDKFFPWIAVDPTSGVVGICFYDSRLDAPANQLTDLFLGISDDGGESFRVMRISDASFDPSVSSFIDSVDADNDTLTFFGDYNGLAAFNGMWYPVWTDSRVGYDQEIYIGIVNPRRPEAVQDLEVNEEAQSHYPVLTWTHSGLTTFGVPLDDYEFHIKRSDGASIDLPSDRRSFRDSSALPATTYIYEMTAVAATLSSVAQEVRFIPFAVRKPQPPVAVHSVAEPTGFFLQFRIPDKNVAGDTIRDLDYLYYVLDGITVDSFKLADAMRGTTKQRSFMADIGYHMLQLVATTAMDGEIVSSDTTAPIWVYAGPARETYQEDFEGTQDIFTINAWDTTSVFLPSVFFNDSVPLIPYRQGVNSWFVLPPVRVSSAIHTLEFDHIALVAPEDSALVELSLNNGVSYIPVRRYTMQSEPVKWVKVLSASTPSADSIPLKWHIGNDAIIRFRLTGTNVTVDDGWFVDHIRFTDKLAVGSALRQEQTLEVYPSIARPGDIVAAEFEIGDGGYVSMRIIDMVGRVVAVVREREALPPGRYAIEFSAPQSGAYVVEATVAMPGKPVRSLRGKSIVVP